MLFFIFADLYALLLKVERNDINRKKTADNT